MFDVILGMDWLSQYQAVISCFWKTISLQAPSGHEVVFQGSTPKFSLARLCYMFPSRWLRMSGLLWAITEVHDATLSIKGIPVVCRYPDVFPVDLPGLPLERESIFEIRLVPGTQPIFRSPHKMALVEQVELKKEIDELLAKGFIRPSVSRWTLL